MRLWLVVLALVAISALAARPGRRFLTVLHTSDVHSEVVPLSGDGGSCRSPCAPFGRPCYGGIAKLVSAAQRFRKEAESRDEAVLFLDAGGFSQPSAVSGSGADAAASTISLLGYDVVTLGTHDFDQGPEAAERLVETPGGPQFVLANADLEAFRTPVEPFAVKQFSDSDLRVAVIGVLSPNLAILSSPGSQVSVKDPVAALKTVVPLVYAQHDVDAVVVLSHCGYDMDVRIATEVENITMIVGGHDGSLLRNAPLGAQFKTHGAYPFIAHGPNGHPVVMVYSGQGGMFLGRIRIDVALIAHAAASWEGDSVLIDSRFKADPHVEDELQKISETLWHLREEFLPGRVTEDIVGTPALARMGEVALGSLVADASKEILKTDIALVNAGLLRASLPKGGITMENLLRALPLNDQVGVVRATGSQIWDALEASLSVYGETTRTGRFLHVSGLKYTFDPAYAPGSRLLSVLFCTDSALTQCSALFPERKYWVAVNKFLLRGGDDFPSSWKSLILSQEEGLLSSRDLVKTYLHDHEPYSPAPLGRVSRCEAGTTDHDFNWETPCKACPNMPGYQLPTGSVGECQIPEHMCPPATIDHDLDATTPCQPCPALTMPGRYGHCPACGAGMTDNDKNPATPCIPCKEGQYAPEDTIMGCQLRMCPAGTIDEDMNPATPCTNCGPGHHIPSRGLYGSCVPYRCPVGFTDHDKESRTPCIECGPGHYIPIGSWGPCAALRCPAGFIDDDNLTATHCKKCPVNHYVPPGKVGSCNEFQCVDGEYDDDLDPATPCVKVI